MAQPLAVLLIAAVAILGFLAAIVRPTATVLPAYAALVPVGDVIAVPLPLPSPFNSLSSLIGAVAIAAMLAHVLVFGRGRVPSLPVAAWLLFAGWCAATVLWARHPADGARELTVALPLVLLVVVVAILPRRDGDLERLRLAIVLGGVAVGAYALFLLGTGASLPAHGLGQRFSVGSAPSQTNPNQVAATLVLPLLLSLDLVMAGSEGWRHRTARKLLGGLGALVILVPLVLSGSRGGLLATAAAAILLFVLTWRWTPGARRAVVRTAAWILASLVALAAAVALAVRLSPDGSVADALSSDPIRRVVASESGTSGRAEIWTTGYLACQRYCALGAGIGNFPTVYSEAFAFSGVTRNVGLERPGHNLYLELAVETGVVGIALFGFALAAEWMKVRTTGRIAPALGAAIVGLVVIDVFEGFLWFKYFWLPFIVIRIAEGAVTARAATHREALPHAA